MIEHPSIIDTIRSTIDEQSASLSPEATAALTAALIEREDGIVEHLKVIGERFGLMPPIMAKAMTVIGLGTAPDEDTAKYIDDQYNAVVEQIKATAEQQAQMYRAIGIEVRLAEFVDPMTATVSEVPDAPPTEA